MGKVQPLGACMTELSSRNEISLEWPLLPRQHNTRILPNTPYLALSLRVIEWASTCTVLERTYQSAGNHDRKATIGAASLSVFNTNECFICELSCSGRINAKRCTVSQCCCDGEPTAFHLRDICLSGNQEAFERLSRAIKFCKGVADLLHISAW
jgi:hypothetical protein